jgi:hypothetical protein
MPISYPTPNHDINEILAALQDIDLVGGSGMLFAYSAGVIFHLGEKIQILGKLPSPAYRDVWITNLSLSPVKVWVDTLEVGLISPRETWRDLFNSGMSVEVEGQGEIQVIVRSSEPVTINQMEIVEMIPVDIQLYLPTGGRYVDPTSQYQSFSSPAFESNLQKFLNSDLNIDGYKLVGFHSFPLGIPISFNVVLEDDGVYINPNSVIRFNWLNLIIASQFALAIASDVINPEEDSISKGVSGLLFSAGLTAEMVLGESLMLKPSIINHFGRFMCVRQDTGQYDTAIISHYTPNPDPLLGGTFYLAGF